MLLKGVLSICSRCGEQSRKDVSLYNTEQNFELNDGDTL
jgi:hypothetical protein